MCTESDLKDLGLPMGPRKKLQGILKEEQAKKVLVLLHTTRIFPINTVSTFDAFSKFLCNNACNFQILIRRKESMTRKEELRRLRRRESGIRWLLRCRRQRQHRAGKESGDTCTPNSNTDIIYILLWFPGPHLPKIQNTVF